LSIVKVPVYPSERSMHPPAPFVMNPAATETNVFTHHHQQVQVDEYPERPGQPECSYYLKTGDCKFKSNCKYHHPKDRAARSPPCALSDKGLPLRPVSILLGCAYRKFNLSLSLSLSGPSLSLSEWKPIDRPFLKDSMILKKQ
jgi:hypothetical protein